MSRTLFQLLLLLESMTQIAVKQIDGEFLQASNDSRQAEIICKC